eukprot:SAG31_NODE_1558_length_7885_cov_2.567300_2_plen_95_part_00
MADRMAASGEPSGADDVNRTVMSAVWRQKRLGIAIFEERTGKLKFAETTDVPADGFPMLQLFKLHNDVSMVVTPARGDEAFIESASAPPNSFGT